MMELNVSYKSDIDMRSQGHSMGWSIITKLAQNFFHVNSEPGDATRYDYYIVRIDENIFSIAVGDSSINYPRKISTWDIMYDEESKSHDEISKEYSCNYFTYLDCCRSIRRIKELEVGDV